MDFEIELGTLIEKYRQAGTELADILDGLDFYIVQLELRQEAELQP